LDPDLYPGWQALDADPEIFSGPATELLSVKKELFYSIIKYLKREQ
jgi:hypothetical protein